MTLLWIALLPAAVTAAWVRYRPQGDVAWRQLGGVVPFRDQWHGFLDRLLAAGQEGGNHDVTKIQILLQSGRTVTRRFHRRSVGTQSPSNRLGQRVPQPPQGVEGADQHGADRDGADIVVPDGISQIGPLGLDTSPQLLSQLWIEK